MKILEKVSCVYQTKKSPLSVEAGGLKGGKPEKQDNANCAIAAPSSTKYFAPELHSGVVRSKTGRRPVTLPRLRFLEDGGES
jgi:hypothetical protein